MFITLCGNITLSQILKAVLLSALVFPGCGHLYLRQYQPAAVFTLLTLSCLLVLLNTAMDIAGQLASQIESGQLALNITAIQQAIEQQLYAAESLATSVSSWLLLVCWLVAIVDSYRRAKKLATSG